ncbi:MAG TPA: acyloxyacyl hydrolase [Bacteroidia bacterium]|nr:acyloxyacyl hydrolase [Bacteroidia bacterium]
MFTFAGIAMKFSRSVCVALIFVFSFVISLAGQDNPRNETYHVGVSGAYGFLWAHHKYMEHLLVKHVYAVELDVWKQTTGNRYWHEPFHYPQVGIAATSISLGDPQRLGTGLGLYPFINFPLGKKERNLKMHFRIGWGLGWVTKSFDPETNHKNNAIGSKFNACMDLRFDLRWRISDAFQVQSAIGMTHFSNGALKFPNLGINLPMINVGVHYRIGQGNGDCKNDAYDTNDSLRNDSRWHITVQVAGGANALEVANPKRYGVFNILSCMMKQTSTRHRFGFGVDVMWSGAIREKREARGGQVSVAGNIQPGIKFCYELVLGRMSWPFEAGIYLYSPYMEHGIMYNRYGVRYQCSEHLVAQVSLKTNLFAAEYWEVGAGWRF